jgi:hypothetical protein
MMDEVMYGAKKKRGILIELLNVDLWRPREQG